MVDSLFTITSLLSLQGSALAALIVPNVLGKVIGKKFDKWRKYVSLGISFALAFTMAFLAETDLIGFVVAFFNGFLIFASAFGINQMGVSGEESNPIVQTFMRSSAEQKKKFFRNWF